MFNESTNAKKVLDDAMVDSFFAAADARKKRPESKEEITAVIKKRNGYRLWRLRKDYRWLQREMRRLGYSPDDAKDLL